MPHPADRMQTDANHCSNRERVDRGGSTRRRGDRGFRVPAQLQGSRVQTARGSVCAVSGVICGITIRTR